MATLIQNLQSIYNTKIQIKDVIGTQSDVFSEYPSLIEDALENAGGGITPSGSYSITSNGQYDVATYAYAYVNVPTGGSDHDGLTEALAYSVTELYTYMTGPAIYSTPTLYVKGKIAQIDEISSEYNNVTFWINDSGVAPSGGYEYNAEASTHANAAILRRVQYDSNGWVIPNNPTPKVGDDIVWRGTWDNNGQQIRSNAQIAQYVALSRPAASGSYTVTSNGQYDLSAYSLTTVNVPTGGGYETHTVSDVTEFYNGDDTAPYMWGFEANEMDGESANVSSMMYSKKYWGYCYPNEFEFEMNPVINFDNMGFGLNMTSYTDLVKREFTYNVLPDFNTYKGYTYSYEYANPYYNDENAPEGTDTWSETFTYEYNYGEQLLYSTKLDIVQLSARETVAPNQYINGIWRVYDTDNPGLRGYWNQEMGEGSYQNNCCLSIGCLSPDETDSGTVTQFTTSYHGAASYTTGFNPYELCGYTWNAVVNGNGWLVDLISKDSELLATEMRLTDGMDSETIDQAAYLSSGNHEFTQEIELSDQFMVFDGYFVAAKIGDKYYEIGIPTFEPYGMYGENNVIPATGTLNGTAAIGSPNLLVEMNDVENYYSTWSMTLTLHIPDNFYLSESCYWTWTFTGTPRNE